jgi:pilus assembly protein CpaB
VNKKTAGVIAAAVMAVIGTIVLVVFVRGAEDRALEGEELVTALVAEQQIPAGTPVADIEDFLTTEQIPEKIAPEGVIADLVQVQGQLVASDIFAGETLVAGRFVEPEQFSARRGAVEVPEGLLEVTIAMSQEQFIGGVPVPGDKVAVIVNGPRSEFIAANIDPLAQTGGTPEDPAAAAADTASLTLTKIILQQALVTNVQGNALPAAPAVQSATDRVAPAEGSLLITLALDGPDTERLLYVRDSQSLNANLHMALHNGDALVTSEGISVENIINPEAPVG